ncbi:hypothetical protein HYALB_00005984 [Hymenoscyphus albidus]|uniref:Uncharacterized protein n=1 Tax=Hymenoscyphus albidus TaxID=595503 RepID=A0A9N9Q6J5_9HELO|nr:hypothetical protein HYALB_00005984 [Hymenoscyphus albidus]
MPPPPVTPSPRRFVIKRDPPPRKTPLTQEYKPRPAPPLPPPSSSNARPPSITPQFNATRRFNVPSTPRPTATPGPVATQERFAPTPSASRFVTPGRRVLKAEDSIDTYTSSDGLQASIENDDEDTEEVGYGGITIEEEEGFPIEAPSPKRRRLSASSSPFQENDDQNESNNIDSFTSAILSSPLPRPAHLALPASAQRFLAPPSTPLPTNPSLPAFRKPPPFRPPDPGEQGQSQGDPLPEQFSPHRKGMKYIPGGLASELQGWLFNIEATPSHTSREGGWLVQILVDEISGSSRAGMTMIRGRQMQNVSNETGSAHVVDHLGFVQVILAGEGQTTGLQRGEAIEKGKMVGIKGPVWEAVVEGCKWGVGVNWKVLGDG